jgi:hypothetical protein
MNGIATFTTYLMVAARADQPSRLGRRQQSQSLRRKATARSVAMIPIGPRLQSQPVYNH